MIYTYSYNGTHAPDPRGLIVSKEGLIVLKEASIVISTDVS